MLKKSKANHQPIFRKGIQEEITTNYIKPQKNQISHNAKIPYRIIYMWIVKLSGELNLTSLIITQITNPSQNSITSF